MSFSTFASSCTKKPEFWFAGFLVVCGLCYVHCATTITHAFLESFGHLFSPLSQDLRLSIKHSVVSSKENITQAQHCTRWKKLCYKLHLQATIFWEKIRLVLFHIFWTDSSVHLSKLNCGKRHLCIKQHIAPISNTNSV